MTIIAYLKEGLGNQLFQYAFARAVSYRAQTSLKLDKSSFATDDKRSYKLGYFNIREQFASDEEILLYRQSFLLEEPEESLFRFRSDFLNIGKDAYLVGYWQTEQYFKNIADIIRLEFVHNYQEDNIYLAWLRRIQQGPTASIHIRRGDYAEDPYINAQHGVLPMSYYNEAIHHLYSRVGALHFFIFSDDLAWVKDNFKFEFPHTIVDMGSATREHEELTLMSACQHHIIANSTFSWWGAWLNPSQNKVVIAPKHWFKRQDIPTPDVLPKNWIQI